MRILHFARIRVKLFIAVIVIFILNLAVLYFFDFSSLNISDSLSSIVRSEHNKNLIVQQKIINELNDSKDQYGIYSDLFKLLIESKPQFQSLKNYNEENPDVKRFLQDNVKFNKKFLSSLVPLNNNQKLQLFESLDHYQIGLNNLNLSIFGNEDSKIINSKGIVMVGGGKFSWLALLSIHQLRQIGSKLPVEVFIPTIQDYDYNFCETMLQYVNAKCVLGYKELPLRYVQPFFKLKNYEYKLLAMLASEFENILLLDVDNILIKNPDELFNWDIYQKYQLILWPDTWIRTTNPFMFDLFHINVDYSSINDVENDNYDIHDLPGSFPNPSTESGMLLVNKKIHADTLLLALYINIYGANYYYPLISQGSAGEGDKDTYILAAYSLDKPVYQVRQSLSFIGYFNEEGFQSTGMAQCNPMIENEYYGDRVNLRNLQCDDFMFLHLSNPKYFPIEVLKDSFDERNNHIVSLKSLNVDYDVELQIWEIMSQLLCVNYTPNDLEPNNIASSHIHQNMIASAKKLQYINKLNIDQACNSKILPHLQFLREYFKNNQKN